MTVHHLHAVLHKALDDARRLGLMQRNVTELVDPPRVSRGEMHVLTKEEADRFLAAAHGHRLECLFVVAIETGMREGELLALRWRDVDLEKRSVQVRATLQTVKGGGYVFAEPKTRQSRRRLTISRHATAALKAYRARQLEERIALGPVWEDVDLVFCNTIGRPRVPSKAQQSKRLRAAGAPASEMLFVLLVRAGLWMGLTRTRDLVLDSAPILAWRRTDPDAAFGHAPAHHPRPLLLGCRLHTLLCRRTGLPLLFLLSRANVHDAPFARPLLELAVRLFGLRPRVVRLDAGHRGLKLIAWIHTVLGAAAVIPWNPKRQRRRDGLPPTWTAAELGKRTSIERFFGRVLIFFRVQRPPVFGWSAVETRVALTYAAVWVIALAAWQTGRPDLIRSPRLVLAHVWERVET